MLDKFIPLGESEKKLMQTIMLSTLEYVIEVGLDEAVSTVMNDIPDLTLFPEIKKYAGEHRITCKEAAV